MHIELLKRIQVYNNEKEVINMDIILGILGIIALIIAIFVGLSGHLVRINREKFEKLYKPHLIIGTCDTAIIVILVILILIAP